MNKTMFIGNLGSDPQMRYTPTGTPVTNFSVAVNETWKDQAGEKQERTIWYRVAAFGRLAEVTNEYLKKGRKVYVEGSLQAAENGGPRLWTAQDGTTRASFEVRARSVEFLSAANGSAPQQAEDGEAEAAEASDLPF